MFRVCGFWIRFGGLGFRVLGFWIEGLGVLDLEFRVWDLRFTV